MGKRSDVERAIAIIVAKAHLESAASTWGFSPVSTYLLDAADYLEKKYMKETDDDSSENK